MKTVKIPENWTGKEALAVYDFLAEVMEAIWQCYDDQMVEILQAEEDDSADQIDWLQSEVGYDDIPF